MSSKKKYQKDFEDLEKFDDDDLTDSDDELPPLNEKVPEDFDSEDEVYAVNGKNDDDDDDDDEEEEEEHDSMESDIERSQEDNDLPDERAWGRKKKSYYSADYVDPDYATTNFKDMEKAELEEEMAKRIQQNLAEQLDDTDFGLDLLQSSIKENEIGGDEQTVKTDLNMLSKREKQSLFQKENPEFQALIADFEKRLVEVKKIILPFLNLAKKENIDECPALNFMKIKYHLILNYSVNLSFYLELKARKISIIPHPITKRLAQFRQLLKQLEEGQGDLLKEASKILKAVDNGETLYNVLNNEQLKSKMKKRKPSSIEMEVKNLKKRKISKKSSSISKSTEIEEEEEEEDEIEQAEDEEELSERNGELLKDDDDVDDVEDEVVNDNIYAELPDGEKRPINYKIAKNKGLTPYRKKEQRNPRVKHRNKYRKAKIRRKGAVREVRKEINRYDGEISGIKANVTKSRKLK